MSSYDCPLPHVTKEMQDERVKTHSATHQHTCYLFVDQELYWKQARTRCTKLGGEMLSITSEDTMNFIRDTLHSKDLDWSRNGVWLGLHLTARKEWEWTTGTGSAAFILYTSVYTLTSVLIRSRVDLIEISRNRYVRVGAKVGQIDSKCYFLS